MVVVFRNSNLLPCTACHPGMVPSFAVVQENGHKNPKGNSNRAACPAAIVREERRCGGKHGCYDGSKKRVIFSDHPRLELTPYEKNHHLFLFHKADINGLLIYHTTDRINARR